MLPNKSPVFSKPKKRFQINIKKYIFLNHFKASLIAMIVKKYKTNGESKEGF